MTCVKTGANVLINNYGKVVHCDAFTVGNTTIFRFYPEHWDNAPFADDYKGGHIDYMADIPADDDAFWRPDIGVLSVPDRYVTGNL